MVCRSIMPLKWRLEFRSSGHRTTEADCDGEVTYSTRKAWGWQVLLYSAAKGQTTGHLPQPLPLSMWLLLCFIQYPMILWADWAPCGLGGECLSSCIQLVESWSGSSRKASFARLRPWCGLGCLGSSPCGLSLPHGVSPARSLSQQHCLNFPPG